MILYIYICVCEYIYMWLYIYTWLLYIIIYIYMIRYMCDYIFIYMIIYIWLYIYDYIYIFDYIYMVIYVWLYIYMIVYIYMNGDIYIYIWLYIYDYIYIWLYIYDYIYIYGYIHMIIYELWVVCAHPTPVSAAGQRCTEQRGRAGPKGNQLLFTPPTSKVATPFVFFLVVALLKATNRSPLRGYRANICLGRSLAFAPQNRRPVSPLLSWACELITYEWFVPTPPLSAQQDSAALSRGDALALRATSFCSHEYIYIYTYVTIYYHTSIYIWFYIYDYLYVYIYIYIFNKYINVHGNHSLKS